MSIAGKLRETQDANNILNERIAQLESEVAVHTKTISDKDAEIKAATEKINELMAGIANAEKLNSDQKAEFEKLSAEAEAQKARAESAEQKLQNPAFEHASSGASNPPAPNAGEGVKPLEQFQTEYHAEKDSAKRATMWREFFGVK